MREIDERSLRREADVFARSLVGRRPSDAVADRYVAFHRRDGAPAPAGFDAALVRIARVHPVATRMCDAYAARLPRVTALRRKLVLVLALVECAPSTYELVEVPGAGGAGLGLPRLVVRGALEALALLVGAIVLLPLHLILSVGGSRQEEPA